MERGKYFRTRQGRASALRKRRLRRVRVMLEQQPQSKKINAADAIDVQRAVLERLEAAGQSPYRGDVLLQMDFFSSAKDPPAIYRLPKNCPRPPGEATRRLGHRPQPPPLPRRPAG